MNELLKKFSDDLKSRREEVGISLEEIHSKFRIDIKFLKAIEECNFDVLPEIYIKAFIKSYAQAVDLDYNEVLKNFELAKKGKVEDKQPKKKEEKKTTQETKAFESDIDESEPTESKSKSNSNSIIIISAVILIGALTAVYFLFIKNDNSIIVKENPVEELIDENADRFEVEETTSNQIDNTSAADSLRINLKAIDSSWVKFVKDAKDTTEFILLPRREKVLAAKNKFELLIGNSAGIEIYMNNQKLNFSGKKGEVKSIMIDSKGLYNVK